MLIGIVLVCSSSNSIISSCASSRLPTNPKFTLDNKPQYAKPDQRFLFNTILSLLRNFVEVNERLEELKECLKKTGADCSFDIEKTELKLGNLKLKTEAVSLILTIPI